LCLIIIIIIIIFTEGKKIIIIDLCSTVRSKLQRRWKLQRHCSYKSKYACFVFLATVALMMIMITMIKIIIIATTTTTTVRFHDS